MGGASEGFLIAFGTIALLAALYSVMTRYLLRSIIAFGAFLTAVAGMIYLLGGDFTAIVQIFVYIGGVMVLILFGLMLSHQGERAPLAASASWSLGSVLGYAVGGGLIWAASASHLPALPQPPTNTVSLIGSALLTTQGWAFQVIGLVLLASVVAALMLVRAERQ
jgi:NADH:ubiquinone oxidoreductase subunit 6 (subunit J)